MGKKAMQAALAHIDNLLRTRKIADAERALASLLAVSQPTADVLVLVARLRHLQGRFTLMLEAARQAQALSPNNLISRFQQLEAHIHLGQISDAKHALTDLTSDYPSDVNILQRSAEFHSHIGQFDAAWRCLKHALSHQRDDPHLLYNAASAAMAVGHLDEAEALFDRVIKLRPTDYDAYYNRSTLRKQTRDDNHIIEIESALQSGLKSAAGEVQLRYALAKELEDLGQWQPSFAHLKAGADCRAKMLSYDVNDDLHTMQAIQNTMDSNWCKSISTDNRQGPIFILGMPRTGTTLVDRILSAHPEVNSLGEINDFALAMMREIGPIKNKGEAVEKSAFIDFNALATDYLRSTRERAEGSASALIDKTPANFLYIGLIAKALPNAKIVNLIRDPMDTCYAIYKTLFRMGYPFSYDLDVLADYFAGYQRLMQHWHRVLPGRIISVRYEDLVTDIESVSCDLVQNCGLKWHPDCLNFHNNQTAVATASAAQVRQPIYKSSVQQWQHFTDELAPLKKRLQHHGVLQ